MWSVYVFAARDVTALSLAQSNEHGPDDSPFPLLTILKTLRISIPQAP